MTPQQVRRDPIDIVREIAPGEKDAYLPVREALSCVGELTVITLGGLTLGRAQILDGTLMATMVVKQVGLSPSSRCEFYEPVAILSVESRQQG